MKILQVLYFTAAIGIGSAPAAAQTAASPEALQAARDLVSLMSGTMMSDAVSKMTTQVWPPIEAALRNDNAKIDPATLLELRREFERLMSGSIADVMKEAPAIYVRHFSAQDMRDMLAFYRTPAGASALKAMPHVTAEISAAVAPRMQGLQEKVNLAFLNILQQRGLYAR